MLPALLALRSTLSSAGCCRGRYKYLSSVGGKPPSRSYSPLPDPELSAFLGCVPEWSHRQPCVGWHQPSCAAHSPAHNRQAEHQRAAAFPLRMEPELWNRFEFLRNTNCHRRVHFECSPSNLKGTSELSCGGRRNRGLLTFFSPKVIGMSTRIALNTRAGWDSDEEDPDLCASRAV